MLTLISYYKRVRHRVWKYCKMQLGYTMTVFNLLVSWYGLQYDKDGILLPEDAEFSL